MPTVRKKTANCDGHQLVGNAGETMAVIEWVRRQGYPWLLGDANHPETLAPEGGKAGDPGIYIEPSSGELVIHTGRESFHAAYTDWIINYPGVGLRVVKQVYFDDMWEVV